MLGQFASMNMQMVSGSLLLYRLTGSAALLGTMSLVLAIPMLFLSMFGGAFADRVQKKHILVIGLGSSALISLGVAVALTTGVLSRENEGSWWILLVSSFLQGSVMGLMMPSRQSIIPEIVSRDKVMNAVALNMLGMNVFRLAAPSAAGFLIAWFDFKAVYYTMTGMNIYAMVFILFLPRTGTITSQASNIVMDIKKGFQYMFRQRTIFFILFFTLIVVIFSMPYQQLLPIFVDDILGVGEIGMGVLMGVSGAGALFGSLVVASLPNKRRGLILLISGLISGAALISFSFSTSWTLSLVFMVFVGLGHAVRGTMSNALLQTYVEPAYMGRVMSVFMMELGLVSIFTFIAGLMAEVMPVQWVIGGLALILAVASILAITFVPRIRNLD